MKNTGIFKSKTFGHLYVDLRSDEQKNTDATLHESIKQFGESLYSGAFWNGFIDSKWLFYVPKREWRVGDYGYNPDKYYAYIVSEKKEITAYTDSWGRKFELPL